MVREFQDIEVAFPSSELFHDLADLPDEFLGDDDFIVPPACWDTPPESPDCSSSECELDVLFPINAELPLSFKHEKVVPPTKASSLMLNKQAMWTPPSPYSLDDLDFMTADVKFNADDDFLLPTAISDSELFAIDEIQPGNKRKAARLEDTIEMKKARARQTRDEITRRTQAALSAGKVETPELKRITHNVLERKRRNDLKVSYQELREQIPELKNVERAPTGQILLKAFEFVEHLKKTEQQLLSSIASARAENEKLLASLKA